MPGTRPSSHPRSSPFHPHLRKPLHVRRTRGGRSHRQSHAGRPQLAHTQADSVPRELTAAEITETMETVTEFFPGLFPNIVRSDAFPDLYTMDGHPLLGRLADRSRIYCATGFSGAGFKNATGFGEIAAHEALGKRTFDGLDFVRPERFAQ
ncbi:FAD-dependent oxidoreductase [Arthrobacter sp. SD76]|uniref:FAD-dependent oxidoreductase n=1 Tax=Arthrobacter sp. SD76 TaxID=3415007 RepID=UPI003C790522